MMPRCHQSKLSGIALHLSIRMAESVAYRGELCHVAGEKGGHGVRRAVTEVPPYRCRLFYCVGHVTPPHEILRSCRRQAARDWHERDSSAMLGPSSECGNRFYRSVFEAGGFTWVASSNQSPGGAL